MATHNFNITATHPPFPYRPQVESAKGESTKSFSEALDEYLIRHPKSRPTGPLRAAFQGLTLDEIDTEAVQRYQRERSRQSRSAYRSEFPMLRRLLREEGIWKNVTPLRVDYRSTYQKQAQFIREITRKTPCSCCGAANKKRALVRKDRTPHKQLLMLSMKALLQRLGDYEVVCRSCVRIQVAGGVNEEAIRDALMSFEPLKSIQQRFIVGQPRIVAVAEKLFSEGHTCVCGQRLAHRYGKCPLRRNGKNGKSRFYTEAQQVAPAIATPEPVAPSTKCKGDRACIFPVVSDGLCLHHQRFFAFGESMEGRDLAPSDYIDIPDEPSPALTALHVSEIKKPRLVWKPPVPQEYKADEVHAALKSVITEQGCIPSQRKAITILAKRGIRLSRASMFRLYKKLDLRSNVTRGLPASTAARRAAVKEIFTNNPRAIKVPQLLWEKYGIRADKQLITKDKRLLGFEIRCSKGPEVDRADFHAAIRSVIAECGFVPSQRATISALAKRGIKISLASMVRLYAKLGLRSRVALERAGSVA